MRDPYSILGVRRNADADEIKAAWRTKAKTIHPDHNRDDPSATDRFAEIGQAYELLKDPERRRRYDRAADMHQTIMQQRDAAERAKAARANAEKVMEELAKAQAARAQSDTAKADAAKAEPKADAAKTKAQGTASGQAKQQTGKKPSESPEETIERIFGGSPEARERAKEHADTPETKVEETTPKDAPGPEVRSPLPMMAVDLIANLMKRIRGTAPTPEKAPDLLVEAKVTVAELLALKPITIKLSDDREVRVPIERGTTDGHQVRLAGQGLKLPNMKQGDLVVTLNAARDDIYIVRDFNLHIVLPISLQDAVLGGEAQVETPAGRRTIEIPSWSGSDRTITIEGLGLHDAAGRGDLVVELRIVLLETPDAKVTDLMRLMRDGLYL
ncbi:DnaJ C-terminal domain-containing protein [Rhizobium sp.]|uniref:J domain-containing protein n=1 Tax=Rhizobium sp. TaxID=391 RepID=UPI0028AAF65F